MPLQKNAGDLIRSNFEVIARGKKPAGVVIGTLTLRQLTEINNARASRIPALPPIIAEVLFYGKHIYRSRIERDGYSVEDVIDQIAGAMDEDSILVDSPTMTMLQNRRGRTDPYGNFVRDAAILECTARHPRPELFSVVPKGDRAKPKK